MEGRHSRLVGAAQQVAGLVDEREGFRIEGRRALLR
jgi:hypothetical protein